MTFVVLLAGGWGERFWPRSRLRSPKQFLAIDGKETLIEKSVRRFTGFVPRKRLRIVALREQRSAFRKEYPSLRNQLLLEPFGRNTAAAITLAAFEIRKQNPNATVVVVPCDQWIRDEKKFLKSIQQAVGVAENFGGVVTIGIPPTYPATGFGYMRHAKPLKRYGKERAYRVERFTEKPNLRTAKRLLQKGSIYWNSGIFVFRIPVLMKLLRTHLPLLYKGFHHVAHRRGVLERERALLRLYRKLFSISFDVSFDCGILERTKNVSVVPGHFGWQDLGSWRSLEIIHPHSRGKNVLIGDAHVEGGKENVFVTEKGHLLAGVGVSGLVAVHTPDATLLCPKERAEEVKKLVASLRRHKQFSRYC